MFIKVVEENFISVLTYCFLSVRKSNTNSWSLAGILYSASLLIRVCGCIVLKAEK